ncbi:hypothetical protein EGW08_000915 [Elysia chlorotica]|uniref:MADF domain-containing protein n=1 Tax=Elysia chlorotica TaxID=188477 RepID=A0A3S1A194_ELYCH|nr:hypothetical protein EGW08_000915 [Elysia chlorotica]
MDTDQTTKLIVAVEKRPFLYDKTDPGYSNRNLLNAEWKKIAEEIGSDEAESRKRWKKLRDYFLKTHRETTTCKSGSAGGKKKKWYLYDRMLFILPFISDRNTASNVTAISSDEDIDNGDDNMSQASSTSFTFSFSQATSTPDPLPPNTIADSELSEASTSAEEKPQPKFPQSRKRKRTDFEREMLRAVQRLGARKESQKSEELDEDEYFFKSLVPKMRRMDITNKIACQGKILNIVLEHIIKSEAASKGSPTHQ